MRCHYWSCSKFADWIRATPKLHAGTEEEWNAWEKKAKTKPVRYWLAEEGLEHLQNCILWPLDLWNNVGHYCHNRFIAKTHALTSSLKRGQYHELDTRILYALFDELVTFVEIEQASLDTAHSQDTFKKNRSRWYRRIFLSDGKRNPQAGLEHLQWAAGLKKDEDWVDKEDPNFGKPTPQALAAQETIALYNWWKVDRPNRPDPEDTSGWKDWCEERRSKYPQEDSFSWIMCTENEEDQARSAKILDVCHKLEQKQVDEDTTMLVRLIKIRGSLWS